MPGNKVFHLDPSLRSGSLGTKNRVPEKGFSGGQGSGGGGGDMERIARLESDVNHIDSTMNGMKSDIRDLRNYFIVLILFTAGGFGGLYAALDSKIANVAEDVQGIELTLLRHESQFAQINQSLQSIQQSMQALAAREPPQPQEP